MERGRRTFSHLMRDAVTARRSDCERLRCDYMGICVCISTTWHGVTLDGMALHGMAYHWVALGGT
eukprot:1987189-Lingulodinium_polyedra.AAC.1